MQFNVCMYTEQPFQTSALGHLGTRILRQRKVQGLGLRHYPLRPRVWDNPVQGAPLELCAAEYTAYSA